MSKIVEIYAEPIRLGYKTHNPYLNRTNLNERHLGVTTITNKKKNTTLIESRSSRNTAQHHKRTVFRRPQNNAIGEGK